ncbi:MAG TPA: DUF1800 domain-containing protein [Gemmatimonadaceae bacterium]|nr:DUF1800 domain-containing protein [Gemmatimonadaceae bacterium]
MHRPFIAFSLVAIAAAIPAVQSTPRSDQTAREQTADQQVRHVLNRLAFGPRPGDYEKVRQMGVDAWIAQQLYPEKIPDPAVAQLISKLPTYTASTKELTEEFPRPTPQQKAALSNAKTRADSVAYRQRLQPNGRPTEIRDELFAERVGRAVVSERQLEEVLTDFWLNHFSVYIGKNQQMRYHIAAYERDVIRPHVFGRFRDMLEAVAKSPAMLIYLDNFQSQADSTHVTTANFGLQNGDPSGRGGRGRGRIVAMGGAGMARGQLGRPPAAGPQRGRANGLNENYARELLELHTLGVDGGYSQHDVTEVARALTGWTIVPPQLQNAMGRGAGRMAGAVSEGEFLFRSQVHDAEPKTVLGVKLKGGRGIEDGEQVLDIVAHHPSTAQFIATKLARRFVADTPPASLVQRAAETFRKTDGDLREVVRTIVTSPEFFSTAAYKSKVKSPFEVVVSAARAVGAPADLTPRTATLISTLGQPVFGRQTPDGWPETGDEWINTGAILNRINFGLALAAGRVPGSAPVTWPLPAGIRNQPKNAQVDAVVAAFLGGEVSPETRKILMEGNNPMLATVNPDTDQAMSRRRPIPLDTANVSGVDPIVMRQAIAGRAFQNLPPLEGVPLLVGLALGSPEFQRR